ncbi:UNVERIFIED_ORG: class I SAM-dependent methyltransferase [Bacillus sp. AZ43]
MPTTASPPPLAPRAFLRWDVVERVLDDLQPKTILELGCGQGAAGARMAARADYLAAEPDETSRAVATARIEPHGGTVLAGDHTAVPVGRTFDVVCAFEVLEHIENDAKVLEEWRRFVRPGGHLLLSMPAWQDRFGPMDEQVGHFRRYDPEALRVLLESAGFTDVRTTLYGWPLGYALEWVRNWAAKRESGTSARSMADRTALSGRFRQPDDHSLVGYGVAVATWPFRQVQRLFPNRGVGLVTTARLPLE